MGTEDFEARVDQAISKLQKIRDLLPLRSIIHTVSPIPEMFDAVSKIEGPIGKDQNKFSAHADWAALKNDDHWLNFVSLLESLPLPGNWNQT